MTNDYTEMCADCVERRDGTEKIIWGTGREGLNRRGNVSNENERVQEESTRCQHHREFEGQRPTVLIRPSLWKETPEWCSLTFKCIWY